MNFALLGDDLAALPLVRALADKSKHRLSRATGLTATATDVLQLAPSLELSPHWDELLTDRSLDAIIVAGVQDEGLEGAKQLASAGMPLLIVPSAGQGSAWIYELTLIRDETRTILFPVFLQRFDPNVQRMRECLAAGTIGKPLHLQIERETQIAHTAGMTPLLAPQTIDASMLFDVDLLRRLGGDYHRVTALYSGQSPQGVSLATISLAGEKLPEASWTLKPTVSDPQWRLTITGDTGSMTLSGGTAESETQLIIDGTKPMPTPAATDADPARLLLDQFEVLIGSEEPKSHLQMAVPDWRDMTRAFEIVDASHRSIRRRRTIDVHFETVSERGLFKTQMTAIGCGLLCVTLFAMVVVLIVGALFDPRSDLEVRSESADSIVYHDDFVDGQSELTSKGKQRIADVGRRMPGSTFLILVEQSDSPSDSSLDQSRRETVLGTIEEFDPARADERTMIAPIHGKWVSPLMRIARIAVFLPLFGFVLLQLLLLVTRPSSVSTSNDQENGHTTDEI